ncbi:MAG: flagellar biosynthetic protein FliR [Defluviitaleaceae bacterium]|nr:flagellar biosynthetic protein FliR [Defluviitaleaceae bacterium]
MESLADQFFIQIYYNIDILLVILARFIGFVVILPVLSGASVPMIARLGLALGFSFLVFTSGMVTEVSYYNTVFGFAMLLGTEFMVGFTLSYIVYLFFAVVHFVGQLMDFQIGFAMVNVLDPVTQIQVPITGNLWFLLISALFIATGGLNIIISAMFLSYEILPIGTAGIVGNNVTIFYILHLMVQYFSLGVRIALPLAGVILVIDITLGLLVKAMPQMNVFVVGMPMKVLIGLMVLFLITPTFAGVYDWLFIAAYRGFLNVMGGLAPE